jgi:hypothetical protein
MKVKLIMNANDVQAITDYSIGHCRRILRKIRESFQHPQSPFVGILSETYPSGKDKAGTAFPPAENTQKSLKKREKTSHRIQKKNTFVT